ncbi:MAG: nicotinate (nicotinamide) nucleotide adenylyltransferase [Peptoniphilaceae bacterium]|nr:nicotinate (nicotinamide) nucleotide adenylyltransferase [Peptoniphilaceae bacterium]MDY6085868.1 nicotinate (nicotinamide) nucleotide adenylyltransferase [Peptoniphilaceae bacterium]
MDETNCGIGILGGTFDPVHRGHLQLAQNAAEALHLKRVFFIPAYAPPHKQNREENADHRLRMLELAVEDEPLFCVDDREMRAHQTNYTVHTIQSLQAEMPDEHFYFILGEDSLRQIRTWYHWEELLSLVDVVVSSRPGVDGDVQKEVDVLNALGYHVLVADGPQLDISSTMIRERIATGRGIRQLVPEKVERYMRSYGLYTADEERIDADFLQGVLAESLDFLDHKPYSGWAKRLKKTLRPSRYRHTLGVVRSAAFLARRYGVDVEKARLAALLHDCAKHNERMYFDRLVACGRLSEEDWHPSPVFHATLGALVAEEFFEVDDGEIIHAIAGHTTGFPEMSLLDQLIYLADAIEPGRDYPGVMALREEAMRSLQGAVFTSMNDQLIHLLQTRQYIETMSLTSRNGIWMQAKAEASR